jgi:hypothetical protein
MTVNVRRKLESDLKKYLAGKKPREVDVFQYLSLNFSQPGVFKPDNLREALRVDGPYISNDTHTVKVTGSSNSGNAIVFDFDRFSFDFDDPSEAPATPIVKRRTFCLKGDHFKGDHEVCVEFTVSLLWGFKNLAFSSLPDGDERTLTLKFALDDERLLSPQGVSGTFELINFCGGDGWFPPRSIVPGRH